MNWITIRNCGYLHTEYNFSNSSGMRNARAFLSEISEHFSKLCANYFDRVGELPFVYRERQISSIMISSIAKSSDALLSEQPVERTFEDKKYTGHLDYWVLYGNTVFLIELKHAWLSASKIKTTKKAKDVWRDALKQIESINSDTAKSLAYGKLNPVKVALMVLPFYISCSNNGKDLDAIGKATGENISTMLKKLSPDRNFISIWNLHERLQSPFYYENRKEIYPYLAMVARCEGLKDSD